VEKVLAIYDSDAVYATRFMEFFQKRKEKEFEIIAFTKKESLEQYLTQHKIEILLFDGSLPLEEKLKDNIRYIYELSDRQSRNQDTGFFKVFKYQAAQQVMQDIMSIYNAGDNKVPCSYSSDCFELVTVFSPIPDAGKLLFAWSLSVLLSERKKVLFIPLDSLPVTVFSSEDDSNQNLSEFIYYLKENTPNKIIKMKPLLRYVGNLAYLSGLSHGLDLFSLSKEEVLNWTEELKNHTDYDAAVFYISHYSDAMVEVLGESSVVYAVMKDNPYEKAVIKEWDRQMEFIGMREKLTRVQKVFLAEEEWMGEKYLSVQALQHCPVWDSAVQLSAKL
jgi:hypothetical protein